MQVRLTLNSKGDYAVEIRYEKFLYCLVIRARKLLTTLQKTYNGDDEWTPLRDDEGFEF